MGYHENDIACTASSVAPIAPNRDCERHSILSGRGAHCILTSLSGQPTWRQRAAITLAAKRGVEYWPTQKESVPLLDGT